MLSLRSAANGYLIYLGCIGVKQTNVEKDHKCHIKSHMAELHLEQNRVL